MQSVQQAQHSDMMQAQLQRQQQQPSPTTAQAAPMFTPMYVNIGGNIEQMTEELYRKMSPEQQKILF